MRVYTYRESGGEKDAPAEALFLFGEEFLTTQPTDRNVRVFAGGRATVLPNAEIICDSCNTVVALHDPCVLSLERLYCWSCAQRWIVPYLDSAEISR